MLALLLETLLKLLLLPSANLPVSAARRPSFPFIAIFAILGAASLIFWLLVKGVNEQQPKPPSTDNIPRMRGRKVDFDNEVAREDCIESKKYQRDASAFVIDLEKEAPAPAIVVH